MLINENILNSRNFYKRFAKIYKSYVGSRKEYLESIDRLVIDEINTIGKKRINLLDVGCGDCSRGKKIKDSTKSNKITFLDNCKEMTSIGNEKNCIINDISKETLNDKFDVIFALFNVLGHIENENLRIQALSNMKSMLKTNGILMLDVNNGYNIKSYGSKIFLKNFIKDVLFLFFRDRRNVVVKLNDDKGTFETKSHVFIDWEMRRIIKKAGLKLSKRYVVNYENGNIERYQTEGQLFYVLTA